MLKQEQFTTLERKIERFSQLLEQRPDDGLTVLALAEASFRRGLKLEALTAYQVVTRKKPVPEAHLAVAEIYSQQNMTAEAYGELRQLFELDPENVEARLLAQQLSKQAPPPDDIAYILSQPTTDRAFQEARLRFQIQRTIHNRELQERTRNVTLEPGVVIHEYYVEEAKKKLIDVDESLRALEALKEANSTLVSTPRPELASAEEVEESAPAADVVGEVGELTSPTLDPPELTTEAPEVEAEPISAQAQEEVETAQAEEQLSEAVEAAPPVGEEVQDPVAVEESSAEPVAEDLQVGQVQEPQVAEQPEVSSVPASESEEAGSEAPLSPEAIESVDAVSEESSAPAEASIELEAESPQAQEQELAQEQAPAPPEQFAEEMGAVPEPAEPGSSAGSIEEPEAAPLPTSPEPAEPVLEFDSHEQNEFELAPPELPEESSGELEIGLEPIQQAPDPVESSEEVRTIQLGEAPEEFSPPSLEELPEQSEVQQVEQETMALAQPEAQEQPEEQSSSFNTDFTLSVESPLDPELPDEESDMKPIEMIGEEIPMPTMQVGPTSYAEGSDSFDGEGPSIEIDMSGSEGSEAPSPTEESSETAQQDPEDFSTGSALAPPPAAEPEPETTLEPTPTPDPVSESDAAAVSEPVVQPEPEAIPEPVTPLTTSEPEAQLAATPVEQIEEPGPIDPPDAVASNAARQEFYISKAEELGKLTSTLARTRGVTSIFLVSRDGMTIDSEAKDAISEQRIGELVRESFDFLLAYADSPNYWVLECSGGIFVMQTLDERHVLIAIGQAGANFGALRYTMDKTRAKFGAILEQAPA